MTDRKPGPGPAKGPKHSFSFNALASKATGNRPLALGKIQVNYGQPAAPAPRAVSAAELAPGVERRLKQAGLSAAGIRALVQGEPIVDAADRAIVEKAAAAALKRNTDS